jgi:hypothetical protein
VSTPFFHTCDHLWLGVVPIPKGLIIRHREREKRIRCGMTKTENPAVAKAYHREWMQKFREEWDAQVVAADLEQRDVL